MIYTHVFGAKDTGHGWKEKQPSAVAYILAESTHEDTRRCSFQWREV